MVEVWGCGQMSEASVQGTCGPVPWLEGTMCSKAEMQQKKSHGLLLVPFIVLALLVTFLVTSLSVVL